MEEIAEKVPKRSPKKRARKPPMPKEKKAPSKFMLEIFRMNFVELIHRVDKNEKNKRIEALRTMRRHLASKFMTVYKAYRAKKHGEEFDPKATYVWPKDKKVERRDPLIAGLEDIDDFNMEYPSPLKIRSDNINDQLD